MAINGKGTRASDMDRMLDRLAWQNLGVPRAERRRVLECRAVVDRGSLKDSGPCRWPAAYPEANPFYCFRHWQKFLELSAKGPL